MGWFKSKSDGVIGDSVVDIMVDAIEKITTEYEDVIDGCNRKPTKEELHDILDFLVGKDHVSNPDHK